MELEIINENDIITGNVRGRLDTLASSEFENDMKPLMEHADKHIILNCEGLDYISSSGLRLFLTLRKAVDAKGGRLTIRHINEEITNIFVLTGFINLFEIE